MEPLTTSPVLVDQVYRSLLGAIADRSLPPGQRILQAELATSLGVSRQPVSHALQMLKQQGLVQDTGRKGLEVAPIDAGRIRQLYEVRAALDALAARLAAARRLPCAQLRSLRDALAAGAALPPDATVAALVQADVDFHPGALRPVRQPGHPGDDRRAMAAHAPLHGRRVAAGQLPPPCLGRARGDRASLVLAGDADAAGQAAYAHADHAGKQTELRLQREAPPG